MSFAIATRLRADFLSPLGRRKLSTCGRLLYKQQHIRDTQLQFPSVSGPEPAIPPYPYGPRQTYHQANKGLYGTASIRFGNRVSERNEVKTRRQWRPNVQTKRLWSAALGVFVRTRVTTRVLRTIDKVGGLDAYLLGGKAAREKELGPWGWRLRWRVMQAPSVVAMLNREREGLGLPPAQGLPSAMVGSAGGGDGYDDVPSQQVLDETDAMLARQDEFPLGMEGDGREGREEIADKISEREKAEPRQ